MSMRTRALTVYCRIRHAWNMLTDATYSDYYKRMIEDERRDWEVKKLRMLVSGMIVGGCAASYEELTPGNSKSSLYKHADQIAYGIASDNHLYGDTGMRVKFDGLTWDSLIKQDVKELDEELKEKFG